VRRLALLLAGCAAAAPVPLAAPWPAAPGSYDDIYRRWTRRGEDHNEMVQTIAVSATLEGPEFRAAYARERARRLGLGAAEEAQLIAAEQAAADAGWDVELLVATWRPELNDLRKADKKGSMWHLALIADDGRRVDPVTIKVDKRHREDVAGYFADLRMFYQPYIVTFPKNGADGQPLAGPATKSLALEVGGSVGQVQLVWSAQ
jgi:hypothetical protein